jgi:hypothetical protein
MLKRALVLAAFSSVCAFSSEAQVITQWNFDSLAVPNTAGTTPPTPTSGSYLADVGTGLLTAVHASGSTVWSTPVGNGSAKAFSSNNWGVGDYYQFEVSTVGFSDINIGFMQNGSNTGPSSFKVQYSTDGTTFTDFATYSIPTVTLNTAITWNANTYNSASTLYFDLSAVTALNNAATVYFRLTDNGTASINGSTVGTGGTSRVDTFTVSEGHVDIAPIPEPGSVAMVTIGLGAVLFVMRRRRA